MIESLTSLLTERLGAHWRNYALGSAICFGLVGLAGYLWITGPKGLTCPGTGGRPWCRLAEHDELGTSVLLVIAAVTLIAVAGAVAAVAPFVLDRISEPRLPSPVRTWWIGRQRAKRERLLTRTHPRPGAPTLLKPRDAAGLGHYPHGDLHPTTVGNILVATQKRIETRYGLNLGLCWTAFVEVLPDPARTRLAEQSTQIMLRVQHLVYVPLTACWAIPFAAHAGGSAAAVIVLVALGAVVLLEWVCLRRLAAAVGEYADQVTAVVATRRRLLYQACGFGVPAGADAEPAEGRALSEYLGIRTYGNGPATFQWPPAP